MTQVWQGSVFAHENILKWCLTFQSDKWICRAPIGVAGIRKTAIMWYRNDLRVHDNEALSSANEESLSVLPVYCFDPRDYGIED